MASSYRNRWIFDIRIPGDGMSDSIEHKYTRESIFTTPFEILHRRWLQGRKLLVDITLKPGVLGGVPEYVQKEVWTTMPSEEIHAIGYEEAKGLHDSILWWGVMIYVRIHNAVEFDIKKYYPDKKDTAYTLGDALASNTDKQYKKLMARAQLTENADWQKLFLILIIGAGAILGTKMMGFW